MGETPYTLVLCMVAYGYRTTPMCLAYNSHVVHSNSCMVATQELYGSHINVPTMCEQLPHVSVFKHVIPVSIPI